MSATALAPAPVPGWYPDPEGDDARLRWWDGATWTNFATDAGERDAAPGALHGFTDVVADAQDGTEVPLDDEELDDLEPIEFSWTDPSDLFEVRIAEPDTDADRDPVDGGPFAFRARALDPRYDVFREIAPEVPALPVYESPLATITSPIPVRVEVPIRIAAPLAPQPQPEPVTTVAPPAPVALPHVPPAHPAAAPRRRYALAGTGAVVAVAAAAALATNLLTGGEDPSPRKAAAVGSALSSAERGCLREWNTTASGGAAQLRVTLGQFQGAYAKVGRVAPLPGTVMAPDSCALTVYDPGTDTRAVFVSGVESQVGYIDVTSYPRASEYGAPRTARQANVAIRPDGSITAR